MKKRLAQNPLTFRGNVFAWKNCVKYLGVHLDQRLCFRPHIDKMVAKARGLVCTLYCLLKKNNSLPLREKTTIYRQIIRPVLTYACPIFTNCPKTHFNRLQIQQNKVLRLVTNAEWHTRTEDLHTTTNIPTVRDFVDQLTNTFYESASTHSNELIKNLGTYSKDNMGIRRLKHRLPKPM